MGILSNRRWDKERRSTVESQRKCDNSDNITSNILNNERGNSSDRSNDKFIRLLRHVQLRRLYNKHSRSSISIYPELFWTRPHKSDNNSKSNHNRKRHRYNKYVYPIATALLTVVNPSVALANVGGVSATANPIANSSGSVTNQAIQVLQGPYITNTYGNQISCQGATANFTPYVQYSNSYKEPWEDYYNEPQYNLSDFTGRTTTQTVTVKNYPWEDWYDDRVRTDPDDPLYDANEDGEADRWWEDGADMQIEMEIDGPDGIPDNPGQVTWEKPVRTDMKANSNFNVGLSATLSWPMDKKLQKLCKAAAETQILQQQQLTANKRLDFEIARLKNCGELMKAGIMFHPKSPYAAICADVVVTNPGGTLVPHSHNLPELNFPSKNDAAPLLPDSVPSEPTSVPEEKEQVPSSLTKPSLFRWPFSRQVSPPSKEDLPEALLGGPMTLQLQQYQP